MDYKTLHGSGSRAASSRSIAGSGRPPGASGLGSALLEGAFETIDEVEGRLAGVAEGAPAELVEPALVSLTSGGKRLRPLLLVLSARMGEPELEELLRAATAIEVLHTATLIHDDIVDRAESRRGVPTTVAEYGREIAAATGDYLFAEAFSGLAGIGDPRLVRAFAEASVGLAAGELEQYRANGADVEVEAYLEHIRKKTAGLFQVACVAGGTLGGLSLVQIDALASYGQALGIAFQMSDDIMDLVGKPGLMGKGIGTDLVRGHRDAAGDLRPEGRGCGDDPARPRRPEPVGWPSRGGHRGGARHGRHRQDRGVGQGRDRRRPRRPWPSARLPGTRVPGVGGLGGGREGCLRAGPER